LPYETSDKLRVLDLGAGTGALSLELLNRYPNASVTCVDYSEAMITHAKEQLAKFTGKVTFTQVNLRNPGWSKSLDGCFDAVVSSFVTHTMPDSVKELYEELYGLVKSEGYFLSCDIYSPPGMVFAKIYHRISLEDVQYRIKMKTGVERSLSEVEELLRERREKYLAFFQDSADAGLKKPTVMEHLALLKEIGFDEVDCLLKYKSNAIIGGFRKNE
jgi:tRNA (cmo5U34)-methyltransferase